jgi:hypothetical protein
MGFTNDEWIDKVILDFNDDIDLFIENHVEQIVNQDICSIRFIGFHLSTVKDECAEIKQYGLRSLREVLSMDSDLSRFLLKKGLRFDVARNILIYDGIEHDVDYAHYKGSYKSDKLIPITHRLCYDPQVNGFFCCSNPSNYSTIHRYPEFLLKIEDCFPSLTGLGHDWATERKPYIITFSVPFEKIEWYTFYDRIEDYHADSNTRLEVKKKLVQWSYLRMRNSDSYYSDQYIYISEKSVVEPQEIIKCECI